MTRRVSQSRTIFEATLLTLAQLAAIGCGSTLDPPAERQSPAGDVAAVVAALEQGQISPLYAALPTDPILTVGHGAIVLADGSVVAPTYENVREYQLYYIERLRSEASPEVAAEFDELRLQVEAETVPDTESMNYAYLIDWLIARVQPADSNKLTTVSRFLAVATKEENIQGDMDTRKAYHAECKEAGVPIPPDWDPAGSAWTRSGTLSPDFIGAGTEGTVWYYVSTEPRGLCIALPRAQRDGTITLLGIICQGKESSNACFWDNARVFHKDDKAPILSLSFNSGRELKTAGQGTCTNCHRGENIFIIHPGSALDIDERVLGPMYPADPTVVARKFDLDQSIVRAKTWVKPLVHTDWLQDFAPDTTLDPEVVSVPDNQVSCLDCHTEFGEGGRLGRLNPDYCGIMFIALLSEQKTMPSKAPRLDGFGAPAKHLQEISEACHEMSNLDWPVTRPEIEVEPEP